MEYNLIRVYRHMVYKLIPANLTDSAAKTIEEHGTKTKVYATCADKGQSLDSHELVYVAQGR